VPAGREQLGEQLGDVEFTVDDERGRSRYHASS
jgi:hypothetical protein